MVLFQDDFYLPLAHCLPSNMLLFVHEMYKQVKKTKQSGWEWLLKLGQTERLAQFQHEHMQTYASTIRYCRIVCYFYNLLCSRINPLPVDMAVLLLPGQNTVNDLQCAAWFSALPHAGGVGEGGGGVPDLAPLFSLICKLRTFKKPSKQQATPVASLDWKHFKRSKAPLWPYYDACIDMYYKMHRYVNTVLIKYNVLRIRDKSETYEVNEKRLVIATHRRRKSVDWTDFYMAVGQERTLMERVPFISAALQYMILDKFVAKGEMIYKLVFF